MPQSRKESKTISKDVVHQTALFADLEPSTINHVVEKLRSVRFKNNQLIFLKNDPGDAMYIVAEGRVKIVAQTSNGREVVLNVIRPGECFGELALLDGSARSASAYADQKTHLLAFTRFDFYELLKTSPEFSLGVLRTLSSRFRLVNEMLEAKALRSLTQRLAQTVLSLVADDAVSYANRGQPTINISQSDLALLVGASRVSVNKHLQTWKAAGLIDLGRSRIEIRDTEAFLSLLRED